MGGAYASVAETVGLKPKDVKGAVEEAGIIQDRRCVELKVEVEARDPRSKGCEPFHEGAMCVQGQACQQDCQGFADEEVQGDGELSSSLEHKRHARVVIGHGGRTRQAVRDLVFFSVPQTTCRKK